MGWLLPCNTGSLRKHKPFVPYSVSLSNNDVIAKAFSRNITGSSNLPYSKKLNPQVPVWLSFQDLTLFLGKMHLLCKKTRCFIHYPLFFATLSLIISLQHIKPLSANPTKWSNTLKQFSCNLPTNCLSVFDHFVGLTFKGLSFALVCLAKVYEHSVLPNVMKDPLLIVRVILRKPSVQTLILSRVRR